MSFKSINLIGLILIIAVSFAMLENAGVFGVVDTNANSDVGAGASTDIDMPTLADTDIHGKTANTGETPPPESIKWYSYTGGKYQSADSGKPIMVDVYTDWCGWCKKLDDETYSDTRVIELAANNFISVKVNGDDDYDFAMKYAIRNYPTILFVDSEGNEIHRVIGFRNADQFLADMETVMLNA